MQESGLSLPVGCFFRPSDEHLVAFYLFNKISGNPIPYVDDLVPDYNLYGSVEPWKIWKLFGGHNLEIDQDLYFFTQLKKKTVKGSRISRKVGSGSWQGEDAATIIVSRKTNQEIGSKKRFRYENKGSQHNGCWIMHEYSLNLSSYGLDHQQFSSNNYVICRLRKNDQPMRRRDSRKKRKFDEQVQSNQLVLSEDHQNTNHTPCDLQENHQKRPATEHRANHLQFENSEYQEYMFHTPPEPEANQPTPLTEHSSLSEDYQFMSHSPSDQLEENTQLLVTEQTPHDQLELTENGQRMFYVPYGLEESQLFTNEQSPDYQLQHLSDLEENQKLPFIEKNPWQHIPPLTEHTSLSEDYQFMSHSPSDQLGEYTQLLMTEQTPHDQLELIEKGQCTFDVPSGVQESQQLFTNEQSPEYQLQHCDYYSYMIQHLSDLEDKKLPFIERSPLQHILPISANLEENQQLVASTAQHTNIDEVVYSKLTEDNSYVPNDFLYCDDD